MFFAVFLAGCGPRAFVHPDYLRLQPATVAVAPVANETIHQLDEVTFGGLVQRALTGGATYDVPEVLRGALEEALFLRGYHAVEYQPDSRHPHLDFRHPVAGEIPPPPFEAFLTCSIEEWGSDKLSAASMHMRYRIEMYQVPTAELLFSGKFSCGYRDGVGEQGLEEVASQIRGSVKRALSRLPPAGDGPQG